MFSMPNRLDGSGMSLLPSGAVSRSDHVIPLKTPNTAPESRLWHPISVLQCMETTGINRELCIITPVVAALRECMMSK